VNQPVGREAPPYHTDPLVVLSVEDVVPAADGEGMASLDAEHSGAAALAGSDVDRGVEGEGRDLDDVSAVQVEVLKLEPPTKEGHCEIGDPQVEAAALEVALGSGARRRTGEVRWCVVDRRIVDRRIRGKHGIH
jgi:hypothetical protein